MVKVKKNRRKNTYRYDVNRKRQYRKLKRGPAFKCKEIKEAWTLKSSAARNIAEMGLVYDVNKTFRIPTTEEILRPQLEEEEEESKTNTKMEQEEEPPKKYVVEQLEADAKAPRPRLFRLPKNEVHWLSYLIEKYGEDYKAMVRDPKNYYQETWRQLQAKIKTFKGIPEQYEAFLQSLPGRTEGAEINKDIEREK